MREVVLSVKLRKSWIAKVVEKYNAVVRVIDCRPSQKLGIAQLVEVNARPEVLDKVVKIIKNDEDVRDAHITRTKRGKILGVVVARDSRICKVIENVNCFCLTCPLAMASKPDGTVDWLLAMPENSSNRKLLSQLNQQGVKANITRVSQISDSESLTAHQRSVIEYALSSGFYEYPRRTGLQELSRSLGVSPSTLNERLRRAERKIISSYLRIVGSKPTRPTTMYEDL
jgi:predicted DNA binding protein